MSMMDYEREAARAFANDVVAQGLRAFLAERGTYGFFTDDSGDRVVCFQVDYGSIRVGGNYATSAPRECGTGWRMTGHGVADSAREYLDSNAPHWAVGSHEWRHITMAEYLAMYQRSSNFVEVRAPEGD